MPGHKTSPGVYHKQIATSDFVGELGDLSVWGAIITQHCNGYGICRRISGDIADIPYNSLKDPAGVLQGYSFGTYDLWHVRYFSI